MELEVKPKTCKESAVQELNSQFTVISFIITFNANEVASHIYKFTFKSVHHMKNPFQFVDVMYRNLF